MDPKKEAELKPVLIFDGDCTFCNYSVDYWRKLTDDKVEYRPYQEVSNNYPSISIEQFKRAIQYIAPNGTVSSGAKASFLVLSKGGKGFWLWLYQYVPGFAFIAELMYKLVAANRGLFYKISVFFWGRHPEPPTYKLISWLFLRGMGLVFFFAFVSFGVQDLGLIGNQGILPVNEMTNILNQQLGTERYWYFPMLFWLNNSDVMIHLVCWGGAFISLLLMFNVWPRISLTVLYVLYLSLICAGQVFMTFQWDLFLLEAGLISIILVGFTRLGIWLLRWLLFRFIFAAGIVKLLSGDYSWVDFTALNYHFWSQPLPTPLAWYANLLSSGMLKIGAISTLFIEICLVFLIFFPRNLRLFSAFSILLLQFTILITGNYNFFNIQTMILCLVLFDDAAIRKIFPRKLLSYLAPRLKTAYPRLGFLIFSYVFAIVTILLSVTQAQLRLGGRPAYPLLFLQVYIDPLRLVNTYGPFAVMTKDRFEIIVEGSDDGEHWKEYEFRYKPGNVNRRPLWNIPHQPRLDWQMWFASLGSVNENPWFVKFLQLLLQNSPDVVGLLETNPFPEKGPLFIRAQFYDYRFTNEEERGKTGAWWKRRLVGEYYPSSSLY